MHHELVARGCAAHAEVTVAGLFGHALILGTRPPALPSAVHRSAVIAPAQLTDSKPADHGRVVYDSVLSLGELWQLDSVGPGLTRLLESAESRTRMHFCEPTTTSGKSETERPWDITRQLWLAGWSVIESHRFCVRGGRRSQFFVRGIARPVLGRATEDPQSDAG